MSIKKKIINKDILYSYNLYIKVIKVKNKSKNSKKRKNNKD